MTPNEVYALPALKTEYNFAEVARAIGCTYTSNKQKYEFGCLCQKGFSPVVVSEVNSEQRIMVSIHLENCSEKAGCRICSVSFDGIPFMIFKTQGKWYHFCQTYVTNLEVFSQMQEYICTKLVLSNSPFVTSGTEDIADLENLKYTY